MIVAQNKYYYVVIASDEGVSTIGIASIIIHSSTQTLPIPLDN